MFCARLAARGSSFGSMQRPFLRFSLRRMLFIQNNARATFKNRRLFSLLGIVGVGTGLGLTVCTGLCEPSPRPKGGAQAGHGPAIKVVKNISDCRMGKNHDWQYVIIGCGTAAWAAVRQISKNHHNADILMIAAQDMPTSSDPKLRNENFSLSYQEWRRHVSGSIPSHYGNKLNVLTKLQVLTGHSEYHVDSTNNQILLADGSVVGYGKLCIASTGTARTYNIKEINPGGVGEDVTSSKRLNKLQDMSDFEELQEQLDLSDPVSELPLHADVAVVGGGFLGTEISLGCTGPHRKVYQLFPENCVLDRYIPTYLALHTRSLLTKAGVTCMPHNVVKNVSLERRRSIDLGNNVRHNRIKMVRTGDLPLLAHYVTLASTHIDHDISSARDSGFELDKSSGGICVNSNLEVTDGIYVAGNSASWYDPSLGRRRVSRYDHAKKTGEVAGHNMSAKGKKLKYSFQPGFRSNMHKIGVEASGVGIIDSNLKTVGIWCSNVDNVDANTSSLRKGIVYYLKENERTGTEIVGCLLWNTHHCVEEARKLLSSKESRSVKGLLSLKNKIDLGSAETLNIMVEKKVVPSVAELTQMKAAHEEKQKPKKLRY